jgi:hypothetical protein
MSDVRDSVIVALLLACVSTAGHAQSFFVLGVGRNSCGMYLSAVHNHPPGTSLGVKTREGQFFDEHARYIEWLGGFISATNFSMASAGPDQNVRVDSSSIDVWVRKWCEQNPTRSVIEAAMAFVRDQRR